MKEVKTICHIDTSGTAAAAEHSKHKITALLRPAVILLGEADQLVRWDRVYKLWVVTELYGMPAIGPGLRKDNPSAWSLVWLLGCTEQIKPETVSIKE